MGSCRPRFEVYLWENNGFDWPQKKKKKKRKGKVKEKDNEMCEPSLTRT